ncbi:MAG: prepilin peptidase [Clostridia bacterium]|nr:prepilin peptidase [Clostridia bacterium]
MTSAVLAFPAAILTAAVYIFLGGYLKSRNEPPSGRAAFLILSFFTSLAIIIFAEAREIDALYAFGQLAFLILTAAMAVTDAKSCEIPDALLVSAFVLRAVLIIPELLIYPESALVTLAGELLAAALTLAFFMIICFLFRGGIGSGDIKLYTAAALYLGGLGIFITVALSMTLTLIIFAILFFAGKAARNDRIPLVPGIYAGIIASIFITEMIK